MIIAKFWAQITIQRRVTGQDSLGQPSEEWTEVEKTMSDLRHLRGLESLRAGAETSLVKASFRIRNHPSLVVNSGMRILWNDYVYHITSVLEQERGRYLDLTADRVSETKVGT
jgi:SPP1 family predicted phage head-tail adaptor